MIRLVSLSSSGSFLISYLWVDLCCLIARHARLWEIPYLAFAAATAYLRLAGLTSLPPPHPLVWHYLGHNQKITSTRTNQQLEDLKQEINKISEVLRFMILVEEPDKPIKPKRRIKPVKKETKPKVELKQIEEKLEQILDESK